MSRHTTPSSLPPPIIIYLPPGPLLSDSRSIPVASRLADNIAATVVQIDYRLNSDHHYPTPVHDVLFGLDWITANLIGARPGHRNGLGDEVTARIGVMGELIGGSLATMLALTECHSKGHRIAAAATNDPILDWLFPEIVDQELAQAPTKAKPRGRKNAKVTLWESLQHDPVAHEMTKIRPSIFRGPSGWFDPFASPTLFFRSPGIEVPKEDPGRALDEFQEISRLDHQDFMREQLRLSSISTPRGLDDEESASLNGEEPTKKPRKAARRFPSIGSGLTLPNLHITTQTDGILYEQAAEFVHLVRRSMVKADEFRHMDPETAAFYAEERASHLLRDVRQEQHWHKGWEGGISDVAEWFREVL